MVVDIETNDTMVFIYGDSIVNQTYKRTVTHYNRFDALNIPLHIGYIKDSRKWMYGLHTGLDMTYYLVQKGKFISAENEVQTFGDASNGNTLYQNLAWAIHLNPIIAYKFNDRFGISLKPQN